MTRKAKSQPLAEVDPAITKVFTCVDGYGYKEAIAMFEAAVNILYVRACTDDPESFATLLDFACKATMSIQKLTIPHFEMVRRIARKVYTWPVLLNRSKVLTRDKLRLLAKLDVGGKCILPIDWNRAFSNASDAKVIAGLLVGFTHFLRSFGDAIVTSYEDNSDRQQWPKFTLIEAQIVDAFFKSKNPRLRHAPEGELGVAIHTLGRLAEFIGISEEMRKAKFLPYSAISGLRSFIVDACHLPDTGPKASKSWSAFGESIISFLTDGQPDKYEVLKQLGLYRKNKYYNNLKKQKSPAEIKKIRARRSAEGTERADIRDGINTRIREAYKVVLKEMSGDGAHPVKSSPEHRVK